MRGVACCLGYLIEARFEYLLLESVGYFISELQYGFIV